MGHSRLKGSGYGAGRAWGIISAKFRVTVWDSVYVDMIDSLKQLH